MALPHAYATAPWTVPSHASLFSGLLPRAAGLAEVPDGSTVVELPAAAQPSGTGQPKPKSVIGTGNTSQAAADILSKYYRRPRSS